MCPLLRHPNAVPSLFSQANDQDQGPRRPYRCAGPVSNRLEALAIAVGLNGEETLLGRAGRAFAGGSIAIFLMGLPVLQATKLLVSVSLSR